ncbi:MAG: glycosyltransferase family 4 protein [Flavobacteriales bacterium]|nr:glycosyltransferase family 4 protein [Flavobacteriales bacterium]MCB9365441.1 glycosyltransferase family 4 protein [Flavobacteriales bacterium]
MKLLFLHRSKSFGGFSFEELFTTIKKCLIDFEITDFYDKEFPSFWKNVKTVKKINSDIIHITGGVGYYSLFLPTNKTVLTFHDTNHYEFDLKGIKKWLYGWIIYKIPAMNVAKITTVSNHTKNNLVRYLNIPEQKIEVIPNCYPLEFKQKIKEKLNSTPTILHIGTKPNKNLNRLIEATKGLKVELVVIGKLTDTQLLLLKNSNINFTNKFNLTREEIYTEYINCDIVAFISLHEGFGLPIIEANAIGRAVITSNLSSMPEVAKNAALLVDPYKIEEITAGLIKLIDDDGYRNDLINKGYQNAQNYTPNSIANKYKNLYQSLVKL